MSLHLDERQRAMLAEMHVFQTPPFQDETTVVWSCGMAVSLAASGEMGRVSTARSGVRVGRVGDVAGRFI